MSILGLGNAIISRIMVKLLSLGEYYWNSGYSPLAGNTGILVILPGEYWNLDIRPGEYSRIWLFAQDIENDIFRQKMSILGLGNNIRSRIIVGLLSLGEHTGIWLFAG